MKLVQAIDHIPAIVRLSNHLQPSAFSALISFLNGYHSNFLNAFFMRPFAKPHAISQCSYSTKSYLFKKNESSEFIYLKKQIESSFICLFTEFNAGEIFFWTATINNWQHLLLKDDYKNVIINSLSYLSNTGKIDVFGFVPIAIGIPNYIHLIWRINGDEW